MNETEAQQQMDILVGQRIVMLSDKREITVRAYSFMDGLKVNRIAQPLMAGLRDFFEQAAGGSAAATEDTDERFSLLALQEVFSADPDAMVELLAFASDLTAPEVAELNDADGSLMLWAWWNVNSAFFVRRLVEEAGARAAVKTAKQARQSSLPA